MLGPRQRELGGRRALSTAGWLALLVATASLVAAIASVALRVTAAITGPFPHRALANRQRNDVEARYLADDRSHGEDGQLAVGEDLGLPDVAARSPTSHNLAFATLNAFERLAVRSVGDYSRRHPRADTALDPFNSIRATAVGYASPARRNNAASMASIWKT
jgi:hypothetical protein